MKTKEIKKIKIESLKKIKKFEKEMEKIMILVYTLHLNMKELMEKK